MTHDRLVQLLEAAKDSSYSTYFVGSGNKFAEIGGEEMVEILSMAVAGFAFMVLPIGEVEKLRATGRELFKLNV